MAPPRKPLKERNDHFITVRFTEEQEHELKTLCERLGVTPGAFVRAWMLYGIAHERAKEPNLDHR